MTVLRINKKERNFLILDKTCLNQMNLSWGAKGLHAYLMGLPDNCRIQVSKLINKSSNGRDSVRNLINELKKAGYITTEWLRNESDGKYSALEYIVHELPQPTSDNDTAAQNPLSEMPVAAIPKTDFQAPANLSPGNQAHINISINNKHKDQKNKLLKTAANKSPSYENFAAAFSVKENKASTPSSSFIFQEMTPEDMLIGATLTHSQMTCIRALAQKVVDLVPHQNEEQLFREIQHCLLSSNHFKACGKDFARKLNAIRVVIERGTWTSPASMIIEETNKTMSSIKKIENELNEARAEEAHFKKLLETAKAPTRKYCEEIITQSRIKINQLEGMLYQASRFAGSKA